MLNDRFTYDAPVEISIKPSNLRPFGTGQITIVGKNFGSSLNVRRDVAIGATSCTDTVWQSDSQVVCLGPKRGTGAYRDVRVRIGGSFLSNTGRTNENPKGLSEAFSYDSPIITAVLPTNGPPVGYTTEMTIFGKNFGFGPAEVSVKT